jgi:L-ascorbate metabolism protein UlaG (beta-lactamase superfamily)
MKKTLILIMLLAVLASGLYAKDIKAKTVKPMTAEEALSHVHWLHHASFRIETGGKVIYIDPYRIKGDKPADFILITHEHPDHLSPADIKKIAGKDTVIFCSAQCADKLAGYNFKMVKPGDVFMAGPVKCEAVPAYNTWKPMHQKKDNKVGYILDIGGARIYHAGDTDFIDEMKNLKDITIAMVPAGGLATMGPEEAAQAINAIKPQIAVPMHFILSSPKKTFEIFKKLVQPPIKAVLMTEEEPR